MAEARPQIACEIAADRVLAGRVSLSGQILEVYAARELAPGSVVPDLTEPNIRQPEAVPEHVPLLPCPEASTKVVAPAGLLAALKRSCEPLEFHGGGMLKSAESNVSTVLSPPGARRLGQ